MKGNQIVRVTSVFVFIWLIVSSGNPVFGASIKVACVGDSITWGWGLSDHTHQSYPAVLQTLLGSQYSVKNCGTSGCTMLKQGDQPCWKDANFGASADFEPDVVVVMLGSNDAKPQNWSHKADFTADYSSMIERYRGLDARVYVASPPPVYGGGRFGITPAVVNDRIAPLVRQIAVSANVHLIDVFAALSGKASCFPDTVHPNADGCRLMAQTVAAALTSEGTAKRRLRVVMSTDFPPIGVVKGGNVPNTQKSDPDDMQSMVRFLLYANEFDVEGLIASSGTFANQAKKQNILDVLDRYEMVYDNLKEHDPLYPTADSLRSVTFQGRSGTWGKSVSNNIGAGKDSEASEAIIAIVDKPDPRPVYIGVWGDCSNIAQAIWKVENTRSAAELQTFLGKMRIHQIAHQDDTIDWLLQSFPELFIIYSRTTYQGMFGGRDPISNLAWVNENIRHNHGPLCEVYPHEGMGCTGVCEGDSPSFLWLVSANRGLNDPDDPTQPSWGGQFKRDGTTNHYVDGPGRSSISKWRPEYQAEFAQRADWMNDRPVRFR